jgi:hypothetical protein
MQVGDEEGGTVGETAEPRRPDCHRGRRESSELKDSGDRRDDLSRLSQGSHLFTPPGFNSHDAILITLLVAFKIREKRNTMSSQFGKFGSPIFFSKRSCYKTHLSHSTSFSISRFTIKIHTAHTLIFILPPLIILKRSNDRSYQISHLPGHSSIL